MDKDPFTLDLFGEQIIPEKIKNAIRRNIPIVKETDFLQYARLLQ